ncbi:MAG: hypothetical protein IPL72_17370 [Sulfuritalea sp.]|nr:hypothetical protein [Sulfuritalea sp.]
MKSIFARLSRRFEQRVWGGQDAARPPWSRRGLRLVRTVLVLARDLAFGQLNLRAMSLRATRRCCRSCRCSR